MNPIRPEELFAIVGELFVENVMLKKIVQSAEKPDTKEKPDKPE
jgi:hypothetical protein